MLKYQVLIVETTSLKIKSQLWNARGDFSKTLSFFVLPKIINYVLNNQVDILKMIFPSKITLVHSTFHIPSKINLLIRWDLFFELLKPVKFKCFDKVFVN